MSPCGPVRVRFSMLDSSRFRYNERQSARSHSIRRGPLSISAPSDDSLPIMRFLILALLYALVAVVCASPFLGAVQDFERRDGKGGNKLEKFCSMSDERNCEGRAKMYLCSPTIQFQLNASSSVTCSRPVARMDGYLTQQSKTSFTYDCMDAEGQSIKKDRRGVCWVRCPKHRQLPFTNLALASSTQMTPLIRCDLKCHDVN